MESCFILYVADQSRSTKFYSQVFATAPRLDVPGMTEFALPSGGILGLMPQAGIKALLGAALPDPTHTDGLPRAELYLLLEDPRAVHRRAVAAGAVEVSPMQERDWGHHVAYSLDLDGHVLAFAGTSAEGHGAV
jgi:predicted enzyme related to lactoylglutathione lyase